MEAKIERVSLQNGIIYSARKILYHLPTNTSVMMKRLVDEGHLQIREAAVKAKTTSTAFFDTITKVKLAESFLLSHPSTSNKS
jgi:hypothetical protein